MEAPVNTVAVDTYQKCSVVLGSYSHNPDTCFCQYATVISYHLSLALLFLHQDLIFVPP